MTRKSAHDHGIEWEIETYEIDNEVMGSRRDDEAREGSNKEVRIGCLRQLAVVEVLVAESVKSKSIIGSSEREEVLELRWVAEDGVAVVDVCIVAGGRSIRLVDVVRVGNALSLTENTVEEAGRTTASDRPLRYPSAHESSMAKPTEDLQ